MAQLLVSGGLVILLKGSSAEVVQGADGDDEPGPLLRCIYETPAAVRAWVAQVTGEAGLPPLASDLPPLRAARA